MTLLWNVLLEGRSHRLHDPIGSGKGKKPFGRYNRFLNQDCWPIITHLIISDKYPSSMMDDLALEGTFGFFTCPQPNANVQSLDITPPKVPSRAKSFIRLDGYLSIIIRWVMMDQQFWVYRRQWPLSSLFTWPQIQWIVPSLDLTPPKVTSKAKSSIRLDGYLSIIIRWVMMGQQFWVLSRL